MKLHLLSVILLLAFSSSIATAQQPLPAPVTVTDVWVDGGRIPAPPPSPTPTPSPNASPAPKPSPAPDQIATFAGLRDRIWVEVNYGPQAQTAQINPRTLVLYLNGQEVKGMTPTAIDGPQQNWLAYDLKRTPESDAVWRDLLGSPSLKTNFRQVAVSVGLPGQAAFPVTPGKSSHPSMYLRLYYPIWVLIASVLLIALIALFVIYARLGGLIHDFNPPAPPAGKMKPYSLALSQAAWWFFIVLGSFGFIYLITGDYNTITNGALILMGLGTGTAAAAFMINNTKGDTAGAELSALRPQEAQLAAEVGQTNDPVVLAEKRAKLEELRKQIADAESGLSKPVSEGFKNDILTDANGIALHRFQMVAWTVALGLIFIIGVYSDLAMPQFSSTLLALMGISAVTYLGFKIPEQQTDPARDTQP